MTQFETLLLRQLQKQQNRDEFCDTVLQTQGVSVPVHSCVLSAFSSRFYGTLSSMPVPTAGQRRLIELQAVDACTLLSLVSLLYSGQLHENREQVLSAAQMLGIELPQWEEEEERYGAKVGRRKEREDDDQGIEKEVDAREWGDRMTRRMEEGSAREKEKIRESGTQTKCGRETDERGAQTDERAAQTDLACSESESIQTVYLIDPSTNPTNQETGSCMDIQNTALALQAIHPERKSITSDVLALAPPTGDSHPNDPARKRRPRGRPRVRPLPPISRSLTTMTTTKEANQTVDPTELDLLHSVTPVPAARMETVQPIDTLLDDIMTGLNFLPPSETQTNQHGLMSTTTSSGPPISKATYPSSHLAKPTDAKQHLEGEFGDILDHFLSTFDQHVGCCGIDGGDETLQDKFNAGTDKSDTSIDPLSNTSKTFTQIQPHNPQKSHHQKTQANLLHTSRTLSMETNNDQDGKIRRSKVKKPSRDQKILHQFENQRLTRSQSMKRKLETALISLQNPVKRKCKEKESAEMKKRQRNDHEQSKACVNRKGVKNNKNKAKQVCKEKSQKQRRPREKRQENRFCRNQRSVEKKSHRIDGFNKREKTHQKGRPGINSHCEKKKSRQDHVEAEGKTNGFQAGQSSVKSQIEGTCFKRASYAVEKVRKLLQLQDKEEDAGANKSVEIHQENNRGDESLVLHRCISGAEERLIVENRLQGHLDEIQETEDEGRIMVMGEFGGQKRMNSIVELRQKLGNKRRMADGLRNEEKMSEENSTPFQLHLPSCTAKEKNKEDTISTTESVTNVVGSWPGDPVSALGSHLYQSEVVPLSTQSTMHRMEDLTLNVGDAPRLMSAARLSHTQPCQELLSPHKSMKDSQQLAGSPVDEEDDVDVMEVSNTNSELPAVSIVVLEVDSSTGEEEVEEDFEIDVLGLEPD
ncbi:uncharacterized protein LOC113647761 isoform X2 [Tachysurus fulvidraco]|uniref:uncharacterized protein LOC113647761 isoform X2 n=1 Tax=Tachysurus fulvidraco TaxID=1234273 RepID=UPI001FED7D68|nr:uncharacterized protein LOC113647761 isoform X2 [Tachysurus fulvidraco]